jgi:hypothetical protein
MGLVTFDLENKPKLKGQGHLNSMKQRLFITASLHEIRKRYYMLFHLNANYETNWNGISDL